MFFEPPCDRVFIVTADDACCDGLELRRRIRYGIAFVRYLEHIYIILSVSERDHPVASQELFDLSYGIGFRSFFRDYLEPLLARIDIFLINAVVSFLIRFVERQEPGRLIYAGNVKDIAFLKIFGRFNLMYPDIALSAVRKLLSAGIY